MYLIEILLPLYDNVGKPFDRALFGKVRKALVERFGGLTAFTRNPAEGLWENDGEVARDDIVIFEVMADALEREWWRDYRGRLEAEFRQDRIVVRARPVEII